MKTIAISLITITSLISPLAAESTPDPAKVAEYQRKLFNHMDEDGDGKLTRREFVVIALYACFEDQKPDRKGRLSKKQFLKTFNEETDAEIEWAMMDTDKDGFITFDDVFKNEPAVNEMEAEFRQLDKKGKGYVTLDEVLSMKP